MYVAHNAFYLACILRGCDMSTGFLIRIYGWIWIWIGRRDRCVSDQVFTDTTTTAAAAAVIVDRMHQGVTMCALPVRPTCPGTMRESTEEAVE